MIFDELFKERLRVAHVESHPTEREWLSTLVNNAQIRWDGYSTVQEALASERLAQVDAVLVEASLLRVGGAELVEAIRQANSGAALLLLDDFDDGTLTETCSKFHCQGCLLKHELTPAAFLRTLFLSVEQRRLQQKEEHLRKEAQRLAEAKSEFAAMVSHEILNPMSGILGYSKILRKTELDERQVSYLDTIINTTQSLTEMVKDLLSLSRLEAGSATLNVSTFSPYELLNEVTELLRGQTPSPAVRLLAHCDPRMPSHLVGDKQKLRQIAYNLTQNALKFTDQGHVCICLTRIQENRDRIRFRLSVEDSGRGIPSEKREKVLQPFSQVRSEDGQVGHGLGLTITKKLLSLMNASLFLQSQEGTGTIFWTDLDFRKALDAETFGRPFEGQTFLLLEEYQMFETLLADALGSLGAEVKTRPPERILPGETQGLILCRHHSQAKDILQRTRGLIDRRIVYDCEFDEAGDNRVVKLSGTSIIPDLIQLILSPFQRPELGPERPCSKRALVVDDDPLCREYVAHQLHNLGYEVDCAESGAEGLSKVSCDRYHLITLDGNLGDSDCPEVYRELWRRGYLSENTQVVIISGDPDRWREIVRASDREVSVLGKPVAFESLARVLNRGVVRSPMNPERLSALSTLGEKAVETLLASFLQSTPRTLAKLEESARHNDWETLRHTAHRLRGSAATLGACEVERTAAEIELTAERRGDLGDSFRRLKKAFNHLQERCQGGDLDVLDTTKTVLRQN